MTYRITLLVSLLLISFGALLAQDTSEFDNTQDDVSMDSNYLPSFGDNFAFGYGDDLIITYDLFTGDLFESDLSTLFFHKGFGKNVGVTVGTANSDYISPELIYLTPEFNFSLSDKATMAIQLKTIFDKEFSNVALAPTALISFGTRAQNITIGYSPFYDGEDFYAMGIGDLVYSNGALKIAGRVPITDEISFLSKNDLVLDEINILLSKSGIEYNSEKFAIRALINYIRISFDGASDSMTNLNIGASFRI